MAENDAPAAPADRPVRYGLWDAVDRCWLGTNDAGTGPKTFGAGDVVGARGRAIQDDDAALAFARIAADIARVRLAWPHGRIDVRPYDGTGTKFKDELPVTDTTENVLRKLERGTIV